MFWAILKPCIFYKPLGGRKTLFLEFTKPIFFISSEKTENGDFENKRNEVRAWDGKGTRRGTRACKGTLTAAAQ